MIFRLSHPNNNKARFSSGLKPQGRFLLGWQIVTSLDNSWLNKWVIERLIVSFLSFVFRFCHSFHLSTPLWPVVLILVEQWLLEIQCQSTVLFDSEGELDVINWYFNWLLTVSHSVLSTSFINIYSEHRYRSLQSLSNVLLSIHFYDFFIRLYQLLKVQYCYLNLSCIFT